MKIGEYNKMMKHLTRPDTRSPEVKKAAAEKQFNADLDRKNKLKKSYELAEDKSPVMYHPPSNSFKTENELKKQFDDESMKTWVKNTTAVNKNPGAFKKAVKESEAIENQPGYVIDKDPNLLRRIKMYSDNDLGKEFDKAIAEEDKALKKLGRDPMTILQRNNIKKFDNNDPSSYPSNPEQRRKLLAQQKLEKEKPFIKKPVVKKQNKLATMDIPIPHIDMDIYKRSLGLEPEPPTPEPVVKKIINPEDDPRLRGTIFGTDVLYRRKRGLDE